MFLMLTLTKFKEITIVENVVAVIISTLINMGAMRHRDGTEDIFITALRVLYL